MTRIRLGIYWRQQLEEPSWLVASVATSTVVSASSPSESDDNAQYGTGDCVWEGLCAVLSNQSGRRTGDNERDAPSLGEIVDTVEAGEAAEAG